MMAAPVLLGMTAAAPNAQAGRAVENETASGRESLVALRPAAISPAPVAISQARTSAQVAPAANPVVTVTTTVEPRPDYRLRPGDELDILVWKEPELTRRAVVRTDGKIGIPLVGDVPAEDYTPAALSRVIRDQLRTYLTDPVVSVIVVAARKSFVTIQGSVARPGQYPLDGRGTVLQLIAQAGGLSEFARPDRITIFREEAGAVRQHTFNYSAFIAGVNLDQNLELKEDDIVIVP
jgi:polysaccharide export outer membrane protein